MAAFKPNAVGLLNSPLQTVITNLILEYGAGNHAELFQSIVLFGGSAKFPGIFLLFFLLLPHFFQD